MEDEQYIMKVYNEALKKQFMIKGECVIKMSDLDMILKEYSGDNK